MEGKHKKRQKQRQENKVSRMAGIYRNCWAARPAIVSQIMFNFSLRLDDLNAETRSVSVSLINQPISPQIT